MLEFDFDEPDLFTTGAIGPKGQRVFFLEARQGNSVAAIKVEKQQVATLASYLEQMLEMLPPIETEPPDLDLLDDLDLPSPFLWTAGGLEIGYSADNDRIALFIEELLDESDLEEQLKTKETVRIYLRRDQTLAFIRRAREIIDAGRPLCRYCGEPLNTDDGFCPCFN